VKAGGGRLVAELTGGIELEGGVLIIRRVHTHYEVLAPPDSRDTMEPVHALRAERCLGARSLQGAI
jgi:hypothetical protein